MILRQFPDLLPRPATPANAAFRRWFYARWGRENAVICARARDAQYVPFTQTLSVKMASGGAEHYLIGTRRVAVDDDSYLVLNSGRTYGSLIEAPRPVASLSVFFRPGMAGEVYGALRAASALPEEDTPPANFDFTEHLRSHDAVVSPRLRRLRAAIIDGADDELWLEEQLQDLLRALIGVEPGVRVRAQALAPLARSTHQELMRRLDRAADFMLSCYVQPLSLDQIAAAARLSKFHLVRLFRRAYGVTPGAFLAGKRAQAARRLLATTELPVEEVAAACGFGSRCAMFRRLRVQFGAGGQQLRRQAAAGDR